MTSEALNLWNDYHTRTAIREQDAARRKQTPGVAIINLNTLITELATTGPQFRTRSERRAYFAAIQEIAWTARNHVLAHNPSTGELYPAPSLINGVNTALVDQLMEQHQ